MMIAGKRHAHRAGAEALIPSLVLFLVVLPAVSSAQRSQLGPDINGEAAGDWSGFSVAFSSDGSDVVIGAPYNDGFGQSSGHVRVFGWNGSSWVQRGPDIDGEAADDLSGTSLALSSNGNAVAIGAPYSDGNGLSSGHVRVFVWHPLTSTWVQRGADIDGEAEWDESSRSLALSSDGSVCAVGAPYNDGNGYKSGHVRVFEWSSPNWVQRGPDINGEAANDYSGSSVALSSDGHVVAIGAPGNDGNGVGSGHVRVFIWHPLTSSWAPLGPDINGEAAGDQSGTSVALSSDGSRLAAGAPKNDGDIFVASGHVRVFEWLGSGWVQRGADIDGEGSNDDFGHSVALSSDGSRLAVGAPKNDNNGVDSGHVRVFEWNSTNWVQFEPDIGGEAPDDRSGTSVALSSDGLRLAVGAPRNSGNGSGSGHVRVFTRDLFADGFESGDTSAWSAAIP